MRALVYILTILLTSAICSCRSVEYVPVESVRYDTAYINKVQRDSIYERDSIYVHDKGDTVLITKTRYVYRDKFVHDTTYISKMDSIPVPYPVEKELGWIQKAKLELFGYIFAAFLVSLVFILYLCVRKFKN